MVLVVMNLAYPENTVIKYVVQKILLLKVLLNSLNSFTKTIVLNILIS